MGSKTALYLSAMGAVDDFFEMLCSMLRAAMPGAELSTSGCMWWRGYKINQYKSLARERYYFQIYTDAPDVLVFEEAYKGPGHKPKNSRNLDFRIIRGRYFYPFVLKLNLIETQFFGQRAKCAFERIVVKAIQFEQFGLSCFQSCKRRFCCHLLADQQ